MYLLVICPFYHCVFRLIADLDRIIDGYYQLVPAQRAICPVCHIQTGRGIRLKIVETPYNG